MKIGANEVPQGIGDMKRKHRCLRQPSRKIHGCKIRGMYINNQYNIPPYKSLSKCVQIFNIFRPSSSSSRHGKRPDSEKTPAVQSGESKEDYEAEEKRLDREWYGLDEGYDESNNPFSGN